MSNFSEGYLGGLRKLIGSRLVLMPGTRIVVENTMGFILLDLRADFQVWALPGGACEAEEDAEETIIREVFEEAGLSLGEITPFGFASDPTWETTTYPNGDLCRNFSLMFTTKDFSGSPRPMDGESLAYRWYDPAKLPDMLVNHRRSVEAWLRWKAGGGFQLI